MLIMWGIGGVGLLIGLVIGSLGGGGGVLTVPVLVYLLGQSAQEATTSSVIIVGCTAVVGVLARLRARTIAWRTALGFGAVGVPTAYLGTLLNQHVGQHVVLLAFAGVTLLAAAAMLLQGSERVQDSEREPSDADLADGPDGEAPGSVALLTRPRMVATVAKIVACGLVVGFLTGFLGVGGGFLVVPALVVVLRMPMTAAIGTSLLIIAINAVASFTSRVGVATFDWRVILPFAAAAVAGTLAGKMVSDRLSGTALTRAFAVLLVLVGAFVAVESLGVL